MPELNEIHTHIILEYESKYAKYDKEMDGTMWIKLICNREEGFALLYLMEIGLFYLNVAELDSLKDFVHKKDDRVASGFWVSRIREYTEEEKLMLATHVL